MTELETPRGLVEDFLTCHHHGRIRDVAAIKLKTFQLGIIMAEFDTSSHSDRSRVEHFLTRLCHG